MNGNDILELVRAGYTKAEIEALSKEDKTEEKQEVKSENKTEETQEVKEEVNENKGYKELTDLVKNLTETVKAMQADNAKRVSGEAPKTDNSESVIKSFFGDIPKD